MKTRVLQWTTGKVGKMALRAILDDPRLELVGVYAHSKDKIGLDAGGICGRPPCGIRATDAFDTLIALKADSVIYAPYKADLSHIVRLLESGVDIISTNLLTNIGGIRGETGEKIRAACARGNSSLYITGINPGWIDTVAAAATTICRAIDSITVTESVSVAHYESVDTWRGLGLSLSQSSPELLENARARLGSFSDSVFRLADALGYRLDGMEFFIEYATTAKKLDLGWFCMEKGTHAAIRAGWDGVIAQRPVIRNRVVWYMTKDLEQRWDIDQDNYRVDIQGEPGVDLRVRVIPPNSWGNLEHATATATPAVNAIFQVKAAPPGVLGLDGAGLPRAAAGEWQARS